MKELISTFWKKIRLSLTGLGIVSGFVLTILSLANFCKEGCFKGHAFKLLNLPFEWVGIAYFLLLFISYTLSFRYSIFSLITGLFLAVGVGSEIMFILIQQYVIGRWCPLCLGIAASIFISASAWAIDYFFELQKTIIVGQREKILKRVKRAILMLSTTATGFLIAFFGVSKQEMTIPTIAFEEKITFGKENSPIEIYVFTSWVCPACHRYEPKLEEMIPKIEEKAKLVFVDYGVDDVTLNYLPYHLSFMVYNKDHYVPLRKMLKELSAEKESPTDEEIAKKANALGIEYRQINYSDVASAIEYFKNLATELNVAYLPSFVIVNKITKKQEILSGSQVTENDIFKAIEKMQGGETTAVK